MTKEPGVRHCGRWIPIHLIEGVEYEEVQDGATAKLMSIARSIGAGIPDDHDYGRAD